MGPAQYIKARGRGAPARERVEEHAQMPRRPPPQFVPLLDPVPPPPRPAAPAAPARGRVHQAFIDFCVVCTLAHFVGGVQLYRLPWKEFLEWALPPAVDAAVCVLVKLLSCWPFLLLLSAIGWLAYEMHRVRVRLDLLDSARDDYEYFDRIFGAGSRRSGDRYRSSDLVPTAPPSPRILGAGA
jgi:hypothetical protein